MDNKDKINITDNTPVDDNLLGSFFAGSRDMHIADNGFSDSVMQRIAEVEAARARVATRRPRSRVVPRRQRLYYMLWSVACAVACVAVFVFSNGMGVLKTCLHSAVLSSVSSLASHIPALPHISFSALNMGNVSFATPFAVTLALVVVGSLALYDLKES